MFKWLFVSFFHLPWWAMILWGAYFIYFIVRSIYVWRTTDEYGVAKGYKYVFLGHNPKYFRLYHLIRMILDIPPSILGLLFPALKAVFRLKIYEFKDEKDKK